MVAAEKLALLGKLQEEILRMEGFRLVNSTAVDAGLGPICQAFPNHTFPLGAVHEFISNGSESMAATGGFITALLSNLFNSKGACIWIGPKRNVFPPGLKFYGISPERVLFITPDKEKHLLWAVEEALKCNALTAVVAEVNQMDFTASRRLQLVVEQSNVTGFVIRNNIRKLNTNACVARWKITALPSDPINDLPGIGYPRWNVELLRVRNGKPGRWEVQWRKGKFNHPSEHTFSQDYKELQVPGHLTITERKAG